MLTSKKIEIITVSSAEELIIEMLEDEDVSYTLFDRVQGSGKRGRRVDDDFMDIMHNCFFVIVCDSKTAERLMPKIQGIVDEYGGILMISDCLSNKN